ncbi:MAG: FAD:protein FMN transferase [Clostridia bacterium]|nr:FAD:protein FMN transferase [Clostridia bacterium]
MKKLLLVLVFCLFLSACGATAVTQRQIFALDTLVSLTAYGPSASAALDAAEDELKLLEERFAVDSEGELAVLNREGYLAEPSDGLIYQLRLAKEISYRTGGVFDITILPLIRLWGFQDGQYRLPSPDEIASALEYVGMDNLDISDGVRLSKGSEITLGAVAKGYIADRLAEVMKENGVESGIISLGGNVRTVGLKPDGSHWSVAVADPQGQGYALLLSLTECSAVTSGGYQRYFTENGQHYHHILDPRTGYPVQTDLLSVTVVCSDGSLADALSTSLFALGLDGAAEFCRKNGDFEAVFITADAVLVTDGLKDVVSDVAKKYNLEFINTEE